MSGKAVKIYELILAILAFLSVAFMWSTNKTIMFLDRIVWFLLFMDVLVRFITSKQKLKYVLKNPFDIIAAIPLDTIFHSARIVRLFRILRFVSIGGKYINAIKDILKTNGLNRVFSFSVAMLVISSILVTNFEPNINSYADGLWWSIVTTTTVGYGDISPNSIVGRLVAIFLMIIGIGLIGMLTGSITTYFVKGNKQINPTIEFIKSELDRFEELNKQEKNRLILLIHDLDKESRRVNSG